MTPPKDIMRALLTLLLVCAFMVALFLLFSKEVPDKNVQLVTYMLGQLSGFTGAMIAIWSVSSKSSAEKNAIIAKAFDRPKGTPNDPVHTEEDDPLGNWRAGKFKGDDQ